MAAPAPSGTVPLVHPGIAVILCVADLELGCRICESGVVEPFADLCELQPDARASLRALGARQAAAPRATVEEQHSVAAVA